LRLRKEQKRREKAVGMLKKYKNIWMFQKFLDEDPPFFSCTVDGNRIFRFFLLERFESFFTFCELA
jgi:hypothetical protein